MALTFERQSQNHGIDHLLLEAMPFETMAVEDLATCHEPFRTSCSRSILEKLGICHGPGWTEGIAISVSLQSSKHEQRIASSSSTREMAPLAFELVRKTASMEFLWMSVVHLEKSDCRQAGSRDSTVGLSYWFKCNPAHSLPSSPVIIPKHRDRSSLGNSRGLKLILRP